MGLIGAGLFVQLADRLAKQARILEIATSDMQQTGGGKYYPRIHGSLPEEGDIDIEDDLIKSASDLDNDIQPLALDNTIYSALFSSVGRHVSRTGGFRNLDAYLSSLSVSSSGINVDDGFAHAYKGVNSSELDSVNVFGPVTNIGYISYTGSGVATLTNENATGLGGTSDHTDTASSGFATGNHAAAHMVIFVASGLGVGADTQLSLYMKLENGNITPSGLTVNFTALETQTVGTSKDIGTAFESFLKTNSAQVAGGANTLVLQVKSVFERTVAL